MKKLIIIPLLFLAHLNFAQRYISVPNPEHDNDWMQENLHSTEITSLIRFEPRNQVEQIKYTVIDRKGRESDYIREFDTEGRLLTYSRINRRNHIIPIVNNQYNSENHRKTIFYRRSGKIKSIYEKEFERGKVGKEQIIWENPHRLTKTNAKNEVVMEKIWTYNENKCKAGSVWFGKKGKLMRKWEYDYYEGCKKSESRLYNGKGELLKAWNYDCKEEGQQLQMKGKTTQICKWDEITKDYLLKITQKFNERGRLVKYVYKYDIKDTLIMESKMYDDADDLFHKTIYDRYENGYTINSISYQKGKERSKSIRKYENKHLVQRSRYERGKLKSRHDYDYEGEKMVSTNEIKNGKQRSKSEYLYDNEFLTEYKVYGKNEELKRTVRLSY